MALENPGYRAKHVGGLGRDDPRVTAHTKGAKRGPPAKPKPSPQCKQPRAGELRGRASRSSAENPRKETVCSRQKRTAFSKGGGKPKLF